METCNGKTILCDHHFYDYLDEIRLVNLKLWAKLLLDLKPVIVLAYLTDRPESAEMALNVCIDLVDAMDEGEL